MTNDQIDSLAKFALEILDEFPDLSSYDGGDLQDLAVKHKLLIPQTVYAPCCDEGCSCAEFYSDEEFKAGVTCYHIADWLECVAEQRDGAVQPQQNLAVADETVTVSQAIDDLLGYLELDLENRELDDKEHWLEVFQTVHSWHNAAKF